MLNQSDQHKEGVVSVPQGQNVIIQVQGNEMFEPQLNPVNENIQVGMVKTFFFNTPAVPKKDAWHSLAPTNSSISLNVGPEDSELVVVPKTWALFLRALIDAPAQHTWAKNLLHSGLGSCLQLGSGSNNQLGPEELSPVATSKLGQPDHTYQMLTDGPVLAKSIEEALPDDVLDGQGSTPTKKEGGKLNLQHQ
jgi:hypothetical protein